jgi:hypothetical protein
MVRFGINPLGKGHDCRAKNLTIVENLEGGVNSSPLFINVNVSVDSERDNSRVVSVVIAVPSDGDGPYGILSASSKPGVAFTDGRRWSLHYQCYCGHSIYERSTLG